MDISDYDALRHLWLNTAGLALNSIDDSREGIEKCLLRNPTTCFVAEEKGRLLGGILAGHDGRRGFIYHLAVEDDQRQRGIGRALTNAANEALRHEGIVKVALLVLQENENANRYWEHVGYTTHPEIVYRNLELFPSEVHAT